MARTRRRPGRACWLRSTGARGRGRATLNSASPTETPQAIHSVPETDYNQIVSSSIGYDAGAGATLVTSLGIPVANLLVSDLAAYQRPSTTYAGPTVGPLPSPSIQMTQTSLSCAGVAPTAASTEPILSSTADKALSDGASFRRLVVKLNRQIVLAPDWVLDDLVADLVDSRGKELGAPSPFRKASIPGMMGDRPGASTPAYDRSRPRRCPGRTNRAAGKAGPVQPIGGAAGGSASGWWVLRTWRRHAGGREPTLGSRDREAAVPGVEQEPATVRNTQARALQSRARGAIRQMAVSAEPKVALIYDDNAYVEGGGGDHRTDGPPGGGRGVLQGLPQPTVVSRSCSLVGPAAGGACRTLAR